MFDVSSPYEKNSKLNQAVSWVSRQDALVAIDDVVRLKKSLQLAAMGSSIVLQAGDCAERFFANKQDLVIAKYNQLFDLANLVAKQRQKKVIVIGRIAGQFAKPRSSTYESYNGCKVLAYHGDIVNGVSPELRTPNPRRMLVAYRQSKKTLNHLSNVSEDFYISHEGLVLDYEQALTRKTNQFGQVNLGAHLLWLGARSCFNDRLIDYFATLFNPIAVKLSKQLLADDLIKLLLRLNPKKETGKIILITRIGCNHVNEILPEWIKAVSKLSFKVVWLVDPMHANTLVDINNCKYRLINDLVREYLLSNNLFRHYYDYDMGFHLELSPEAGIEECVDQIVNNKSRIYKSAVDPRLNVAQALFFMQKVLC